MSKERCSSDIQNFVLAPDVCAAAQSETDVM